MRESYSEIPKSSAQFSKLLSQTSKLLPPTLHSQLSELIPNSPSPFSPSRISLVPGCFRNFRLFSPSSEGLVPSLPPQGRRPLPQTHPQNWGGSLLATQMSDFTDFCLTFADLNFHQKSMISKSLPKSQKSALRAPKCRFWGHFWRHFGIIFYKIFNSFRKR